jgi:hypothetical protein
MNALWLHYNSMIAICQEKTHERQELFAVHVPKGVVYDLFARVVV